MTRILAVSASALALSLLGACAMTDADGMDTAPSAQADASLNAGSAPPMAPPPPAAPAAAAAQAQDIVDVARANGAFMTLLRAAEAANLVATLEGPGPYTVFAPTDAAFAALPEGLLDQLLLPQNRGQLTAVLSYHIVPGRVTSADLAGQATTSRSQLGLPLAIDATGEQVKINEATVLQADVPASNGVIHVIDRVLIPQAN